MYVKSCPVKFISKILALETFTCCTVYIFKADLGFQAFDKYANESLQILLEFTAFNAVGTAF